uniref:BAH domain-containing protein n=1 Tax=Tetranychus urticae TaxID=32264 RepID=T1KTX6_TETUR
MSQLHKNLPNIRAVIQDLLTNLFISVYNHQDEEGRCYSDSIIELSEQEAKNADPNERRPLTLDQIKKNLEKRRYRRLDRFQQDMFDVFERTRRNTRVDSQAFEDSVELQLYFIRLRNELCRNGEVLISSALNFTEINLNAQVDALKLEKLPFENQETDAEAKGEDKEADPSGGAPVESIPEVSLNDQVYRPGDFVYIEPREKGMDPHIINISKLWRDPAGQLWIYGCWFYRPYETYHIASKKFLEKEVFKSDSYNNAPLSQVAGKCFIMFVKDYFKLKPEGFEDCDVYVCESRYFTRTKTLKKIKVWPYFNDHSLIPREQHLPMIRVPSIFKDNKQEKCKEEQLISDYDDDDGPKLFQDEEGRCYSYSIIELCMNKKLKMLIQMNDGNTDKFPYKLTTTTTAEWKSCFDDSCPIKNLEFSDESSSKNDKGLTDSWKRAYATLNDNPVSFSLGYAESGGVDRLDAIAWGEGDSNVLFTCGPVATTVAHFIIYPIINGTAIYVNGKEYCSWSVDINNSSFPFDLIDPPQYYISHRGYQIYYNLNQTVPVAAANYSQLPKSVESFVDGYQYKAVGSEKYILIVREANKTTDFLLKVNGETPKLVEVNLKSDISIDIEFDLKKRRVTAYAKIGEVKDSLWSPIRDLKMGENQVQWSLPDSFDTLYGPVNPKETDYELQILENNMFVHFDEHNFRIATLKGSLKNSGNEYLSSFFKKIVYFIHILNPQPLFDAAFDIFKRFQKRTRRPTETPEQDVYILYALKTAKNLDLEPFEVRMTDRKFLSTEYNKFNAYLKTQLLDES